MTAAKLDRHSASSSKKKSQERQFKGLSLTERKTARREKLIEAGIEAYGTSGFFSVTVKDICNQAKLTERYFYESFKKSEDLFQTIFLKQIETLQNNVMQAVMKHNATPENMIDAGLTALLRTLKDDPRLARIIYIDAMLVQELHNQATIQETMMRFDRMIQALVMLSMPNLRYSEQELSLVSSGLNGYVTQVAIRWVMGGFKQSLDDVLFACRIVFVSLLEKLSHDPAQSKA
ncbi:MULTISPECIES: TetR/AcrR family transcriptional regulator [Acinetobacter]|jgi:AcrR family transcriptional regulator|uniref:TetR family transcriptional regulator n=3 Tax=Gammaproteobacteria TaxID=1236 RepID=A0A1P8EKQ2_9GAMM|nr:MULTISPECIES: TetR/AcrR family transcriptional regulator [Acinetobacter]APV36795.1 TetR family transcriptional regulator [Acinetobacter soli]KOR17029.1 TetR family transcriptional regulator [Acinetobacter sp. C15]KQD02101.1 TetR family transcriptional regulator [Acinetobacter soli]MBO3670948.1 TetR/AcrR family transcriptional regulator [Acinetobacter soli]MBU3119573.1 TetR/AcrR family transcriptional regulator [Acinetobacter soli]